MASKSLNSATFVELFELATTFCDEEEVDRALKQNELREAFLELFVDVGDEERAKLEANLDSMRMKALPGSCEHDAALLEAKLFVIPEGARELVLRELLDVMCDDEARKTSLRLEVRMRHVLASYGQDDFETEGSSVRLAEPHYAYEPGGFIAFNAGGRHASIYQSGVVVLCFDPEGVFFNELGKDIELVSERAEFCHWPTLVFSDPANFKVWYEPVRRGSHRDACIHDKQIRLLYERFADAVRKNGRRFARLINSINSGFGTNNIAPSLIFHAFMETPDVRLLHAQTLREAATALLHGNAQGMDYIEWRQLAESSVAGSSSCSIAPWLLTFEVFRTAIEDRDSETVSSWITSPHIVWPWIWLRVLYPYMARTVVDFFREFATEAPAKKAQKYQAFITSFGVGLESISDPEQDNYSVAYTLTRFASLLVSCGLFDRPSSDEIEQFVEVEHSVIEAFERSCMNQGVALVSTSALFGEYMQLQVDGIALERGAGTTLQMIVAEVFVEGMVKMKGAVLMDYHQWESASVTSLHGVRSFDAGAWQSIFEVFTIALRDERHRMDWLGHPTVFWPWVWLRVHHLWVVRQFMGFFAWWEWDTSSEAQASEVYNIFCASLGVGLELYKTSTELHEEDFRMSFDSERMEIAALLGAVGLYQRNAGHEVFAFLEQEYEVIKAFEASCMRQGIGSIL